MSSPDFTFPARQRLSQVLGQRVADKPTLPASLLTPASEVIITHVEVNEKHGVGVLTKKIFGRAQNAIAIRSQTHFGGDQEFGAAALCLSYAEAARPKAYSEVLHALGSVNVSRAVCIPYYGDDVRTAIAVKDIFNAPLCTYIMDDQNVCEPAIPDALMAELLAKSAVRFAISPEMRDAYQAKYGQKFWLLPPVVSSDLIQDRPQPSSAAPFTRNHGIAVGNIWGQRWMELLRNTLRSSGVKLDWYCNSGLRWHASSTAEELASDGIIVKQGLPEAALVPLLRKSSFTVLPSGTLDASDDRNAIAKLSLPSRLPFILATSNTPVIVLGSRDTAASRFVERHDVGTTADYNQASFLAAVDYVTVPETQSRMRQKAAALARTFSADGIENWIWNSLQLGRACDSRFEDALLRDV